MSVIYNPKYAHELTILEKDIPLNDPHYEENLIQPYRKGDDFWPWAYMQVGDSFAIEHMSWDQLQYRLREFRKIWGDSAEVAWRSDNSKCSTRFWRTR